jgi:hypothetical protein
MSAPDPVQLTAEEARALVSRILAAAGVGFAVTGGQRTQRVEGREKPWECFAWEVQFHTKTGLQRVDFYTGTGHVTKPKRSWDTPRPVPPTAADVLHCLLLDASAADQNFHDWCADLGYDTDSMRAFRTYQECLETGRKLRALFKRHELDELRAALSDY